LLTEIDPSFSATVAAQTQNTYVLMFVTPLISFLSSLFLPLSSLFASCF
jgi:hypothetical protein